MAGGGKRCRCSLFIQGSVSFQGVVRKGGGMCPVFYSRTLRHDSCILYWPLLPPPHNNSVVDMRTECEGVGAEIDASYLSCTTLVGVTLRCQARQTYVKAYNCVLLEPYPIWGFEHCPVKVLCLYRSGSKKWLSIFLFLSWRISVTMLTIIAAIYNQKIGYFYIG